MDTTFTTRKWLKGALIGTVCSAAVVLCAAAPTSAYADTDIYRMYNDVTGEHLYTPDWNEACSLYMNYGWGYEGISWVSPDEGTAVYRLYNAELGNHLYTTDQNEVDVLTSSYGWEPDNNGDPLFYSGGDCPVYRVYNEGLNGLHHLTTSFDEYDQLPLYDWSQEGIALYAANLGTPLAETHYYPDDAEVGDPVGPRANETTGNAVVDRARAYVGKASYVWGACSPGEFDCSGFVSYCLTGVYSRLGTTYTFMTWPETTDPQPGDVCTSSYHCGIYVGNGKMIHCSTPEEGVRTDDVMSDMIYVKYPG